MSRSLSPAPSLSPQDQRAPVAQDPPAAGASPAGGLAALHQQRGNGYMQELLSSPDGLQEALAATFGPRARGVPITRGDRRQTAEIGALASTTAGQVALGPEVQPEGGDWDALAVLGHEVAHALAGPGPQRTAIDQPGDPGEARADQMGDRFADWATGGGAPPRLGPATGGQARTHRTTPDGTETATTTATTTAPLTKAQKADALLARAPATAQQQAQWLLDLCAQGFSSFSGAGRAQQDLTAIANQQAIGSSPTLDPASATYNIHALPTMVALSRAALTQWRNAGADEAQLPLPFQLGSFITSTDNNLPRDGGHGQGQRIDLNVAGGFDASTPDQVVTLIGQINQLPEGAQVDVGLPLTNANFFQAGISLVARQQAVAAAGATGPLPAGATRETNGSVTISVGLLLFKSAAFSSVGTPPPSGTGAWTWTDTTRTDAHAIDYISHAALKAALETSPKVRLVFPDNPNHVHLTVVSNGAAPTAAPTPSGGATTAPTTGGGTP